MVEVSPDGDLARAAARASDGGSVSSDRNGSEGPPSGSQQKSSSPAAPSTANNGSVEGSPPKISSPASNPKPSPSTGSKTPPTPPFIQMNSQQHQAVEDTRSITPQVEERCAEIHGSQGNTPPPINPQVITLSSSLGERTLHLPSNVNLEGHLPRGAAPPPLVRSRPSTLNNYRSSALVTDRVATMARNASEAFDSGAHRLHQQRGGSKLVDATRHPPPPPTQPPSRQPAVQAPIPHSASQRVQQAYKQQMPPLQKPVRPFPIRAYTSQEIHQSLGRAPELHKSSPNQQRTHFNSSSAQEVFVTSTHHPSSPSRRAVLEDMSRKVEVADRTRNGATLQDVTRELSDLVRFPNSNAHHVRAMELRENQKQQLDAAAEDVERYQKEYDRMHRCLLDARDRLEHAQQVLGHHQTLAATTASYQADQLQRLEQRHQQQAAFSAQQQQVSSKTLATLLLSDPPQKRVKLEHVSQAPTQLTNTSPPSAPPAPQHLMSPQLPQPRAERPAGQEEVPIDLSHARSPWAHQATSVEEVWRAAVSPATNNNSNHPPFQITILGPPEPPVAPPASSRAEAYHRHKMGRYRPMVESVSPPRNTERTPSPHHNRVQQHAEPEVVHIQPREVITLSAPQHASPQERVRGLPPGGAVLHQRSTPRSEPPPTPLAPQQLPLRRQSKAQCIRCMRPSGYVCSSCKLATYCSVDCQMQHWQVHERECLRICQLTKNMMSGRPQSQQ